MTDDSSLVVLKEILNSARAASFHSVKALLQGFARSKDPNCIPDA